MRLESLRIRNCFGFVDSGEIDFALPNNLVYVLGRNSSGKTSVLRALSCLEHGSTPQDYPRFANYEATAGLPHLYARFSVDTSAGCGLSAETLTDAVVAQFGSTSLQIRRGEAGSSAGPDTRSSRAAVPLLDDVFETYSALVERILDGGRVSVAKLGNGAYQFFSAEDTDGKIFRDRRESISSRVSSLQTAFQQDGWPYPAGLDFNFIEGQLFKQFPEIFVFTDRFSLDEGLPRSIRDQHLQQRQNSLTTAFMDLLDQDTLGEFLRASGRGRIKGLQDALQAKLDALSAEINEGAASAGADELVRIFVDRQDDARVVLEVDGKESYYEHLSDNTKFLVAYHVFQQDRERKNALNSVLLFDEPNQGFHPSAEGLMLGFLEDLAAAGNQVIVSTHSQHMIDLDRLGAVRLMGRDDGGALRVSNGIYRPASPGGDILALQPVTEAIGLRYAEQLVVKDRVVVTEGYTDMLYLRAFKRILEHGAELNIAPLRGEAQLGIFVPFLVSQGTAFKIMLDSEAVKRGLQKDYPVPDEHFFVVPAPEEAPATGTGIENMLTRNDFARLLERYGLAVNEKRLNNVSNSAYAKQEKIKPALATKLYSDEGVDRSFFEGGTLNAFGSALDFCSSDRWFRT